MRKRAQTAAKRSRRSKHKPEALPASEEAGAQHLDTTSPASTSSFSVVGVGASAGGLAAVTELLKHLPSGLGWPSLSFNISIPSMGASPTDILSRVSPMPVAEVTDGMRIQPDHVYVIPPNSNMRLSKGVLKLSPRIETPGPASSHRLVFPSRLPTTGKDQAIGVVLSGIASDGTMGVQAIKAEGGFTFAQDPISAQYDGMPRSAILSGAVDIVETPEGIAREIAKMSRLYPAAQRAVQAAVEPELTARGPNGNLRKIFALIRNATGVDFTHYKHSTIQRRIARRLFLLKIDDLQTYAAYLGSHPEEVKALFADILIHVTGFFRDPEAYRYPQDTNPSEDIWRIGIQTFPSGSGFRDAPPAKKPIPSRSFFLSSWIKPKSVRSFKFLLPTSASRAFKRRVRAFIRKASSRTSPKPDSTGSLKKRRAAVPHRQMDSRYLSLFETRCHRRSAVREDRPDLLPECTHLFHVRVAEARRPYSSLRAQSRRDSLAGPFGNHQRFWKSLHDRGQDQQVLLQEDHRDSAQASVSNQPDPARGSGGAQAAQLGGDV